MIAEILIIAAFTLPFAVAGYFILGPALMRARWRSLDRPPAGVLKPPRPLTLKEKIAALEPEIKQKETTA